MNAKATFDIRFVSRNEHKLAEASAILSAASVRVIPLKKAHATSRGALGDETRPRSDSKLRGAPWAGAGHLPGWLSAWPAIAEGTGTRDATKRGGYPSVGVLVTARRPLVEAAGIEPGFDAMKSRTYAGTGCL